MLYYDRTDISQRIGIEGMHDFNSTGFLIMDLNFKIMYTLVVIFCQC